MNDMFVDHRPSTATTASYESGQACGKVSLVKQMFATGAPVHVAPRTGGQAPTV